MSERHCCGCPLCQIETELLTEFLESSRQESCRKVLASEPELAAFAGIPFEELVRWMVEDASLNR